MTAHSKGTFHTVRLLTTLATLVLFLFAVGCGIGASVPASQKDEPPVSATSDAGPSRSAEGPRDKPGTSGQARQPEQGFLFKGDNYTNTVQLARVDETLWVHVSHGETPDGLEPDNGLVLLGDDSVLLVNTTWNEAQMENLLELIREEFGLEVSSVVLTDSVPACTGGLRTVLREKIPVMAMQNVADRLGKDAPVQVLHGESFRLLHEGEALLLQQAALGDRFTDDFLWLEDHGAAFSRSLILGEGENPPSDLGVDMLSRWLAWLEEWKDKHASPSAFIPRSGPWDTQALFDDTVSKVTDLIASESER